MTTPEGSKSKAEDVDPATRIPVLDSDKNPSESVQEPSEAELREAKHFWGELFTPDKKCSPALYALLIAIAKYISQHFEPADHNDLTPTQLAAFYKVVGGNYDLLFVDTPVNAIAFIYQQLGCLHSLQPSSNSNAYAAPEIPALKPAGFVVWQTKQLLLGPEEHVAFIQKALEKFDLMDPHTHSAYPKILPAACFPDQPDPDTVKWYETVSQKLRPEQEQDFKPAAVSAAPYNRRSAPTVEAVESSADDRAGAARPFAGSNNSSSRGYSQRSSQSNRSSRVVPRPVQVIHDSTRTAGSPRIYAKQPNLDAPAHRMRRRSWHAESEQDDSEDIDHLELATTRPSLARHPSRDRARSTNRGSLSSTDAEQADRLQTGNQHARRRSLQSRDSGSYGSSRPVSLRRESAKSASRKASQSLRQSRAASPAYRPRRRMSHDEPVSPTDYFPPYPTSSRRPNLPHHAKHTSHSSQISSSPTTTNSTGPPRHKSFSPSTEASFAAHVAHMQNRDYSKNEDDSSEVIGDPYLTDEFNHSTRDRPRIQVRDANGRRYSRDEDYDSRHPASPRSARRHPDDDAEHSHRGGRMRSLSSEGRYAQDRRHWERNRPLADREYDRDDRDGRRQQTRRARFADYSGPSGGNTVGVDGRNYPGWS